MASVPDRTAELNAAARTFGGEAARRKTTVLRALLDAELTPRELAALHDAVGFLRAYPDDATVRRLADEAASSLRDRARSVRVGRALRDTGYPGSHNEYPYTFGVVRQMVRAFPGCLEVDWRALADDGPLWEVLEIAVHSGEVDGLNDSGLAPREWLEEHRPARCRTDLEHLTCLLEGSALDEVLQDRLFELARVPVRYELSAPGTGRCEITLPGSRVHYQRGPIDRARLDLARAIRRPCAPLRPVSRAEGRALIDAALAALCARNLEIHTLIYANPADVMRLRAGRGVEVVLIGALPAFRGPLESLYAFVVGKNGVPVAYGPAGVLAGCCEIGINLFPEFRGGEIRYMYAQVMRALHHALAVERIYLRSYGMGENNDEALASAAFWFYRSLGFRPSNPSVDELARAEEARMAREPGYRSDRRMLRRLSHTEAHLDLSGGRCVPIDAAALSLAVTRHLSTLASGDRRRGAEISLDALRARLPLDGCDSWPPAQQRALRALAPLLSILPDLDRFSDGERAALARIARTRGAPSEAPSARAIARHRPLIASLRQLTAE